MSVLPSSFSFLPLSPNRQMKEGFSPRVHRRALPVTLRRLLTVILRRGHLPSVARYRRCPGIVACAGVRRVLLRAGVLGGGGSRIAVAEAARGRACCSRVARRRGRGGGASWWSFWLRLRLFTVSEPGKRKETAALSGINCRIAQPSSCDFDLQIGTRCPKVMIDVLDDSEWKETA